MMKKVYFIVLTALLMVSCQTPPSGRNEYGSNKPNGRKYYESPEYTFIQKIEQITAEQLDTLTECAINAKSALNKQSWEVRVIQSQI